MNVVYISLFPFLFLETYTIIIIRNWWHS